ncbi:MAG: acyl carrier protein [Anaeromyxobacter sp.]|nr:acyl carrier protein [Anaeromyxobacter sp.]
MISEPLKQVILQELELDAFEITAETVASQVPGWDSLSHVRVISAVESRFEVRFRGLEIMRLKNLGELQALLDRKLAEKAAKR